MAKKIVKKVEKKKASSVVKESTKFSLKEYVETLNLVQKKIQEAQIKSVLSVNKEMLKAYWFIGKTINERQATSDWGSKIIEKFGKDLQSRFPGIAGFSRRSIFRMQAFFLDCEKVPQAVALIDDLPFFSIPWGHNAVLMIKIKSLEERLWYAQKTIENGWSRSTLETQIKLNLYRRQGKSITNFKNTLPAPHSDFAQQSLKDPYIFDFLTLHDEHVEYDIEQGLVHDIQKALLEMGRGFAFIGRQIHLQVSDHDYYIDLLFYHTTLRCYVVVELKARAFDPRDVGQLNFYLSVVDAQFRHPDDKPTIGLLLCKTKDDLIAEYALGGINRPIGVAGYQTELVKKLPKELKGSLPTVEEIEAELEKYELLNKEIPSKKRAAKKKPKKS